MEVAQAKPVSDQLTAAGALRLAWIIWLVMLALPFFVFLAVVWALMGDRQANPQTANVWFIFSLAWLGLCVPVAFFLRSRVFKAYWTGRAVSPRSYLTGMFTVWATIELGGLISLLGCYFSHSFTPNIMPAIVAFILFTPFWPTGRAMTKPVGHEEDPELYRHPR